LYHQGDSIDVAVGEEFLVALPATPSTGYEWTAAGDPDVTFVSTRQVAGGSQPGAEGTQEMTFTGRQAGESHLVFTYARSFEKTEPPAKTAKLPLTVTK
jgi:predicted secreted protein